MHFGMPARFLLGFADKVPEYPKSETQIGPARIPFYGNFLNESSMGEPASLSAWRRREGKGQ
jgi:hypothetical protein